jgi:phosphoglycerate dehydrogenase-like enzyme
VAGLSVLYLNHAPEEVYSIIREQLPQGFELLTLSRDDEQERRRLLSRADFVLVATAPITEEMMRAAANLKLIQHQGVGYDTTDVAAAARLGIPVGLTPEGTTVGVAEHTILLILAVYKRIVQAHSSLRDGHWLQFALRPSSYELAGKTLGLIGMGRIGRAVARRAAVFDARILYEDPEVSLSAAEEQELGARKVERDELLMASDIVSLHVPLTEGTRRLIAARALSRMKENAILINTARGPLVDEQALIGALRAGKIGGAGLDVFEKEPPDPSSPLFSLENVVATPHIAAGTRDALIAKMRAAFANMERVARGERPMNLVEAGTTK